MSGLEFLLRRTLSSAPDSKRAQNPNNFPEALLEFTDFCSKQLPDIVEIDFTPTCFDITENEDQAVFGSNYGDVTIFDLNQRRVTKDSELCRSAIETLTLAHDDTLLIFSNSNYEVFIVLFPNLSQVFRFQLLPQPISLKIGSNKRVLYCSNSTDELRVLRLHEASNYNSSIQQKKIKTTDTICCIDVSDDGSLLALGLLNGVIKLIHGESESELQSTQEYPSPPVIISFSQHRKHIGVGFKDFTLKVWNVDSDFLLKYEFKKHTGDITGLAFMRDNRYMISGSKDKNIYIWDMKVERSPFLVNLIDDEVLWFRCNSNHRRLYFNQNSNCFMIWEAPQLTKNARYRKHSDVINRITFLPNSFEIMSVGSDGLAVIWDYRNDTMQEVIQLEGELTHVIASSYGQFALIASSRPCVYRWNLNSYTIEDYDIKATVCSMKFSQDENMVAVGDNLNRVIVFDTEVMERKNIIKGHSGPVTEVCFIEDNTAILSASKDCTIAKWELSTGNKLETFIGHTRPIQCMIVTTNNWVISGSEDRCIIIWHTSGQLLYTLTVPTIGKNLSIFLSDDYQYMITLQEDRFYYWKMDNFGVMFQCDTGETASCLAVSQDERVIAVAEGNTVFVEENPLKSSAIRLVGKNSGSQQKYMKFILDCIKNNNKGAMDESHNHWVVTPYCIATSHILAFTNRIEELNSGLFNKENPIGFFTTIKEESPLSISVDLEYRNCIDICLKYLRHQWKLKNKRAYVPLGNCLTKLNSIEIPDISRLYDTIFQKANDAHLPSFCVYEANLPALYHSEELVINPYKIVANDLYSSNGRSITFYHSLCHLNTEIGTNDSIEFLVSLTECSSDSIFRSTILQVLLRDKWNKVKWAVFAQGFLYIFYMVQLSLYCIFFRDWPLYLVLLFGTHVLLFLYEASQIITDPIDYWKDMWNILDQLRGLSCTVYCIMVWEGEDDNDVLLSVIMFSWIRGISYFRMFDGTRYFVRLLSEVIKDMKVFFVILFYSTLAFTFIYFLRMNELTFSEYLTVSYRLDLGDFNADYTELFDWIIFFLATVINPLIMLNLLIAIMGDTYSQVQESNDIANYQELTEMIIEIEKLMFWKKGSNNKHYLHQCDFLTGNDAGSDKILEKIKVMKGQLNSIDETIEYIKERIGKSNSKELDENITVIKKEQEDMAVEFQEIIDKNIAALEELIEELDGKSE